MLCPPGIGLILCYFYEKSMFFYYLSSPIWRADFNAVCNARMAIARIFGANARIFILSATVFPISVAIYSIWVGAMVKISLVMSSVFSCVNVCSCIFSPDLTKNCMKVTCLFSMVDYIIKWLDRKI